MHFWGCTVAWFILVAVFAVVSLVTVAAGGALNNATQLANESDFLFSLSWWLLIWGIIAAVVAVLFLLWAVWGKTRLGIFFGVSFILLSGPWLLIGQIFMLRAFTHVSAQKDWVYAVSWFALVISYLNIVVSWWNMRDAVVADRFSSSTMSQPLIGQADTVSQASGKVKYHY